MQEKQSNSSLFAGWPGVGCLAFCSLIAVYLHVVLIGTFLLLLTLLHTFALLWSSGILKKLQLRIAGGSFSCYAGESVKLMISLTNHSLLPLIWLDLILPEGKKTLLSDPDGGTESDFDLPGFPDPVKGIRRRFVWISRGETVEWEESFPTLRRGILRAEGVGLQAGDGFGLSARAGYYSFPDPFVLMIYPRLLPVRQNPFRTRFAGGMVSRPGDPEDLTLLRSARGYQAGDPMKRINWRMLARSGRMTTNIYETITTGQMIFLLDPESFVTKSEEEGQDGRRYTVRSFREADWEQMLSVTASAIRLLAEERIRISLVLPPYGEHPALRVPREREEEGLTACMEVLAGLDYAGETVLPLPEEDRAFLASQSGIYLCTAEPGQLSMREILYEEAHHLHLLALKRGKGFSGEIGDEDIWYAEDLFDLTAAGGGL